MNNVMIDLETLSTQNDACIIAIAAVYFNPKTGELGDEFYTNVNIQSNINAARVIDGSTLSWWMNQEKAAQDMVFKLNNKAPKLSESIKSFSEFFKHNDCKVWGNGSTFDITILETAFKKCRVAVPWGFWNIRDVRTIVDVGQSVGFDPKSKMPFEGVRHNALDDSKHQARYVSAIFKEIIKNE